MVTTHPPKWLHLLRCLVTMWLPSSKKWVPSSMLYMIDIHLHVLDIEAHVDDILTSWNLHVVTTQPPKWLHLHHCLVTMWLPSSNTWVPSSMLCMIDIHLHVFGLCVKDGACERCRRHPIIVYDLNKVSKPHEVLALENRQCFGFRLTSLASSKPTGKP